MSYGFCWFEAFGGAQFREPSREWREFDLDRIEKATGVRPEFVPINLAYKLGDYGWAEGHEPVGMVIARITEKRTDRARA